MLTVEPFFFLIPPVFFVTFVFFVAETESQQRNLGLMQSASRLLDVHRRASLAFQDGSAVADAAGDCTENVELVLRQFSTLYGVHCERTFEQPRLCRVGDIINSVCRL